MRLRHGRSRTGRKFTLLEIFIALTLLTAIASVFTHRGIQLLNHHRFENKLSELAGEISRARAYCISHQSALELKIATSITPTSSEFTPELPIKKLHPLKIERATTLSIQASGWIDPTTLKVSGLKRSGTITIDPAQNPTVQFRIN